MQEAIQSPKVGVVVGLLVIWGFRELVHGVSEEVPTFSSRGPISIAGQGPKRQRLRMHAGDNAEMQNVLRNVFNLQRHAYVTDGGLLLKV